MELEYGPFNGLENAWDAYDQADYLKLFFSNGVFPNPSTNLQVVVHQNMQTKIRPGNGFIEGHKIKNKNDYILTHDIADGVLRRIDRVVMRVNFTENKAEVLVKKGTNASTPVAPTLTRNTDVYELALADVYINNGATQITQANITDHRLNTELCGVVSTTVYQLDTTTLALQYQDGFNTLTNQQRQEFQNWFNDLQVTLDGNVAASLTNRMIDVEGRASVLETDVTGLINQVVTAPAPNKLLKLDSAGMLNFLALPTLSKNIYVRKSDGNGVGIFSLVYDTPVNVILLAYRKSDATQFVFATGHRASWASGTGLNVVASNGLSLGTYNTSGTQVINGAPASDIFVTAIIIGGGQP